MKSPHLIQEWTYCRNHNTHNAKQLKVHGITIMLSGTNGVVWYKWIIYIISVVSQRATHLCYFPLVASIQSGSSIPGNAIFMLLPHWLKDTLQSNLIENGNHSCKFQLHLSRYIYLHIYTQSMRYERPFNRSKEEKK